MKPSELRDKLLHKQVCHTLWRLFPKAMKEYYCYTLCERSKKKNEKR